MATKTLTSENINEVISGGKPVFVDFWANWCPPCRAMGPVVEQISNEMADELDVYKCDIDSQPDLPIKFNIASIPTFILFKDGKVALQLVGSRSKQKLESELRAEL